MLSVDAGDAARSASGAHELGDDAIAIEADVTDRASILAAPTASTGPRRRGHPCHQLWRGAHGAGRLRPALRAPAHSGSRACSSDVPWRVELRELRDTRDGRLKNRTRRVSRGTGPKFPGWPARGRRAGER